MSAASSAVSGLYPGAGGCLEEHPVMRRVAVPTCVSWLLVAAASFGSLGGIATGHAQEQDRPAHPAAPQDAPPRNGGQPSRSPRSWPVSSALGLGVLGGLVGLVVVRWRRRGSTGRAAPNRESLHAVASAPPTNRASVLELARRLEDAMKHDRSLGISMTVEELAGIGGSEAAHAVLGALGCRPAEGRRSAWKALGRIGDTSRMQDITDAFQRERDAHVKSVAVEALEALADARAVPCLVETLNDNALSGKAEQALLKIGVTDPAYLLELLRHPGPGVRKYAIRALDRIRFDRLPDVLLGILTQDQSTDVRIVAAELVAIAGDDTVIDALVEIVRRDPDARMRRAAAERLGKFGKVVLEKVKALLKADDRAVRECALTALNGMDVDKQTRELLYKTSSTDGDPAVRILAAGVLLRKGETGKLGKLIEALGAEEEQVAAIAESALTDAGDAARGALLGLLESGRSSPRVRRGACRVLGVLGRGDPTLATAFGRHDPVREALERALRDPELAPDAAGALTRMGFRYGPCMRCGRWIETRVRRHCAPCETALQEESHRRTMGR